MNLKLATDLIHHLKTIGYKDKQDMTPAINFLKGRGVELTEQRLVHMARLIYINF